MKMQKKIFHILMFLPVPVTLISLVFLPDQIPAHYGSDNLVTRWGSKYETLLFPIFTIIFGLFMMGISKFSSSQEKNGKNNEKICIVAGIFSLLIFNVMTGYFLYTDFNKVENLSTVPVDLSQLIFILLGIFMIVFGNIMPKIRMNLEEKPAIWWNFFYDSRYSYYIGLLCHKRRCLLFMVYRYFDTFSSY